MTILISLCAERSHWSMKHEGNCNSRVDPLLAFLPRVIIPFTPTELVNAIYWGSLAGSCSA